MTTKTLWILAYLLHKLGLEKAANEFSYKAMTREYPEHFSGKP